MYKVLVEREWILFLFLNFHPLPHYKKSSQTSDTSGLKHFACEYSNYRYQTEMEFKCFLLFLVSR